MTGHSGRSVRVSVAAVATAIMMCTALPPAPPITVGAAEIGNSLDARFTVGVRQACEERGVLPPCAMIGLSREETAADVAHYRALVQVGPGPFDVIAVHRLVRERQPGVPVGTVGSFFFLHGSSGHFGLSLNHDASLLSYLADHNVDVWGLDLRWVQVPRAHTGFAFMRDWTFATQVGDARFATRVARHVRRLTGQGFEPLTLAGASLGASLVFAVANTEATSRPDDRDIDGLIPIDTIYRIPPEEGPTRTLFCQNEAAHRAALAAGGYTLNSIGGIDLGIRALTDPDSPSPGAPLLTNREAALNSAASLTFAPALGYHNYSVQRDAAGRPLDGIYTRAETIFSTMANFTPWRARATMADYFGIACGVTDLPYDDHLAEIDFPILYVGTEGGMGREGLYVLGLLGSQDITTQYVQLLPEGQAADDFGHLDWQAADLALGLVWEPIRAWVVVH